MRLYFSRQIYNNNIQTPLFSGIFSKKDRIHVTVDQNQNSSQSPVFTRFFPEQPKAACAQATWCVSTSPRPIAISSTNSKRCTTRCSQNWTCCVRAWATPLVPLYEPMMAQHTREQVMSRMWINNTTLLNESRYYLWMSHFDVWVISECGWHMVPCTHACFVSCQSYERAISNVRWSHVSYGWETSRVEWVMSHSASCDVLRVGLTHI